MASEKYLLKIVSILLLTLWIAGCGLPKATVSSIDQPEEPTVSFEVSVVDGILEQAEVQLVSLKSGVLSDVLLTNNSGQVTIKILKSRLTQLDNDDLIFLYAGSTGNTELLAEFTKIPLQVGQVQFRSILPKVPDLKRSAEFFDPISKDPSVGNLCQVSHFTNARTVLVENFLQQNGLISAPIKPSRLPDITFDSDLLQNIEGLIKSVDQDLLDPSSVIAQKYKLITVATKAIVEKGISRILLTPSQNWSLAEADQILFELAKPTPNGLHPSFESEFAALEAQVVLDQSSGSFPFTETLEQTITQITVEDTKASVATQLVLEDPVSLVPSLTATTPLRPKIQFQYRS